MENNEENMIEDGEGEEVELFDEASKKFEVVISNDDKGDLDEDMDDQDEEEEDEEETDGQDDSIQRFLQHKDSVFCVSIHPLCNIGANSNTIAVSGGGDDMAFLWNIISGEPIHTLSGHKDSVVSAAFNFNGKLVVTGSLDGTAKVWDVDTGKLLFTLEGPQSDLEWVEFHPKGNIILGGSSDTTIWMWNCVDGGCLGVFSGHQGAVTCGNFTPDGKMVVSGSEDGTIKVWDPKKGAAFTTFKGHGFHDAPINCLEINQNNLILSGAQDGTSVISSISTGKILGSLSLHQQSVETVGFSAVQPFAATGSLDNKLNIFDLNTLQIRGTCNHSDGVTKLLWHPTQPFVVSSSVDKTVRLWDGRSSQVAKVWKGHSNAVLDIAFTKDGGHLLTASDDQASLVFQL